MRFLILVILFSFAQTAEAAETTVTLTLSELQALVDSEISQDHLRQAQSAALAAQTKAKTAYDKFNAAMKLPEPEKK